MHVLQLGPLPPPEGGVSRNVEAIRKGLVDTGHQCSIITVPRSREINSQDSDIYRPQNSLGVLSLLFTLKHDILHLHIGGGIPPRLLGLIAVCGRIGASKKVLTLHSGGYANENFATANPRSPTGWAFRQYQKIICVNSSMIEMFQRFGVPESRLHLISPFSVSWPDETVEIPLEMRNFALSHSPFLLTVGLLEDAYRLDDQIESMEKLLDVMPQAGLMIVGSGSLEGRLRDAIASKPYAERILLTGDVRHEITLRLIHECDILLRTTKFDGDAISVREAMHLGIPVIATDNGMRPEGVNLIPNPFLHDELVQKIVDVFNRAAAEHLRMVGSGRENITAVVDLYEDLLNQ